MTRRRPWFKDARMENADSDRPTMPDGVAEQHGQIALLIRRLGSAHHAHEPWPALARRLDELRAIIRVHFATEEHLMRLSEYPKLEQHMAEHESFRQRLELLRGQCEDGKSELMEVLTDLLETWFRHHEATSDQEAAAFIGLAAE